MYDRQTETLWSHFTGQGIVGELTGVELDVFRWRRCRGECGATRTPRVWC
jgi:hypothetical protein